MTVYPDEVHERADEILAALRTGEPIITIDRPAAPHGTNATYCRRHCRCHCRCRPCTAAHAAYERRRRAKTTGIT